MQSRVGAGSPIDAAGRQTGLIHRKGDGTLLGRLTYTLDGASNRTLLVDASGVRTTCVYDKSNQLTREQRNGGNALSSSRISNC